MLWSLKLSIRSKIEGLFQMKTWIPISYKFHHVTDHIFGAILWHNLCFLGFLLLGPWSGSGHVLSHYCCVGRNLDIMSFSLPLSKFTVHNYTKCQNHEILFDCHGMLRRYAIFAGLSSDTFIKHIIKLSELHQRETSEILKSPTSLCPPLLTTTNNVRLRISNTFFQ